MRHLTVTFNHMNRTGISYSIGEVAELAKISRRTVRFYVQRNLIDPPLGLGRGRHYTGRHIEQIRRIRGLQRQGINLDQIATLSAEELPKIEALYEAEPAFNPVAVLRVELAPGIVLELNAEGLMPSRQKLNALAIACTEILKDTDR